MGTANRNYVVISPVKDEAAYMEATLCSLVSQTVRPSVWVIVDDGSRDETPSIVERFAAKHDWIRLIRSTRDAARKPGSAVIEAFNHGLEQLKGVDFDFVVKLDCDLDLPPDYFERLLDEFEKDTTLGIGSGVYLEERGDRWVEIAMPEYHAAGASKMIRAACWRDIQGFVAARGWDTLDEIRAQVHGWTTNHFRDIQFRHLKREGSGIGSMRTNYMHGEIYYRTGGGPLFLLFKSAHRAITGRPVLFGAIAMLSGYISNRLRNAPRLVSDIEAQLYRKLLNDRLMRMFSLSSRRTTMTVSTRSNS